MGFRIALIVVVTFAGATGCVRSIRPDAAPRNGVIRPGPGVADPVVADGIANGDFSLGDSSQAGYGCIGYVSLEPSFIVELAFDPPFLRIFTESGQDTTLMIRTPTGQYLCNDNSNGWNAAVEGQFRSGAYAIWVGSRYQNLSPAYRLGVTSRRDVTSIQGGVRPAGAVTATH